ncbi:hypothetical protein K439DRAFT_1281029, partial [Ramaria rubella]
APANVNADRLYKAGATRVNIKQRNPYTAREWDKNTDAYEVLRPSIDAILYPIMQELQTHLPDIWTELEGCADVIPNSMALPGYPFASLIINLQAITNAHKDAMDNGFCLVVPIGPHLPLGQKGWEGGDLCFAEYGIVWELDSYQAMGFASDQITHYNLH